MRDHNINSPSGTNRRRVLKSLGVYGVLGTAFVGKTAASSQTSSGITDASEFFQRRIDRHGTIVDTEISGLESADTEPTPDWQVKYTFEDGAKLTTFYALTGTELEVRVANERFRIDRDSYEQTLNEELQREVAATEARLDDELTQKATEITGGSD